MGRAPCCDKANVKKGPWSPEEDAKLKSYIEQNGTGGNWIALPQKIGLKRCGKSCRLRWLNYLRPNIKHGGFSEEEDRIICSLYISIGSRWSIIAAQLPGRTDNDIKNYWNTRLKKKLLGKQRKDHHHPPGRRSKRSSSSSMLLLEHHHQPNNHNNSINPPTLSNYNHPFYTPNYNPNNNNELNDINISYWPSAPAELHPATSSSLPAASAIELVNNNPYCSASFDDDQLGLPGQTSFTDQNPSIMKSLMVKMEGGGDHSPYADFDGGLIINSNIHHLPLFVSVPQQINEDPPADHVGMMDMISSSSLNMINNMSNEYKYHNLEKFGQSMVHGGTNATSPPATATTVTTTTTTTGANNNPYSAVELDQLMSSINPPQSSNSGHNYETSVSAGLDIMAWNEMMINRNGSGGCGADSIESWGEMSSLISLPIPAPVHLCGELEELRYTTGVQ